MPRTADRFSRLRALEPARPAAARPDRPALRAPDEEDRLLQLLGAGVVRNHFGEHLAIRNWYSTDRKSTRLNSSHGYISYAVFCLKKKKKISTSKVQSKQDAST